MQVAIDSSVLVGLINPRDLWRKQSLATNRYHGESLGFVMR